jgi:hypothetical protein
MMSCRYCGSYVTGNFCANCGAPLTPAPAYPAPAAYVNQSQNNMGKYLMGALGGAAAILGGEMLLHDVERDFRRPCGWGPIGGSWGYDFPRRHHHHHHHRHHRW